MKTWTWIIGIILGMIAVQYIRVRITVMKYKKFYTSSGSEGESVTLSNSFFPFNGVTIFKPFKYENNNGIPMGKTQKVIGSNTVVNN